MRSGALIAAVLSVGAGAHSARAQVDVAAVDVTTSASTRLLEDELNVTVDLAWQGVYAGDLDVRVRISPDATIDASDPVAFTRSIVVTSTETSKAVTGPVPQRQGVFFLIAEVDPSDAIEETNEDNNEVVGGSLTIQGGDLQLSRLVPIGSGQGFPDQPFAYRVEYRNGGPSDVQDVQLVVELRPAGSASIEVLRTPPEVLGATATRIRLESFEIPVGTSTGTAELTARVLTSDPVDPEPLNDVAVLAFPVRSPVPDYRGQIIATSTSVEAGDRLVVNRVVENAGLVDAPATELLYVLSEDESLATTDLRLGEVRIPALAVDQIDVASDVLDVPLTVAPGNYRLGFIMDPEDRVEEVLDANEVSGPRIDVFPPDLRVATTELPIARLNVPYEVALVAVGGTSPTYTWTLLEGAVPGVDLDPGTGILSGVPTLEGEFLLTLEVQSGTGRAQGRVTVRVVDGVVSLTLDDVVLPAGVIGRAYDARLVPRGGVTPYVWTAESAPPASLSLEEDGRLSGFITETSTGVFGFEVAVRDAAGDRADATVTMNLVEISQQVSLLPDPLPDGVVGRPYCDPDPVFLRADGAFPPFVFSAAFPPPGLTVEPDGRLCGVPSQVGTSTFSVNVRDDQGLVDRGVLQLRVLDDDSVRIITERIPPAQVGRFYEAELRAEGGAPPYRFDLSVGTLPSGFELQPGGRLVGTATATGRRLIAVRATDTRGASRQAGYELVVVPSPVEDEGCDCRAAAPGASTWGLPLLLVLAGWARRRRAS